MVLEESLKAIGLSDKEAKVYLSSLSLGPATISSIAARAAIKRTTVYEIIYSLEQRKLLSVTAKGRRRLFIAADPAHLKHLVEQQSKVLDLVLPQLMALSQTANKRPKIQVFEGMEGIMALYDDLLEEKHDIYSFLGMQTAGKDLIKRLIEEFLPRRVKNNIQAFVIAPDTLEAINYKHLDDKYLKHTKLIPHKKYPFSIEINIYGKKVSFASYSKQELFGVIIESPEIAKTMKYIFDFFWTHTPN